MITEQYEILPDYRKNLVEAVPEEDTPLELLERRKMGGGSDHEVIEYLTHALVQVIDVVNAERRKRKELEAKINLVEQQITPA